MEAIGSFLQKYLNFTPPARALEKALIMAVFDTTGIKLSPGVVHAQMGIMNVSLGGIQKSEIMLHKKNIIAAAEAKTGLSIKDIR